MSLQRQGPGHESPTQSLKTRGLRVVMIGSTGLVGQVCLSLLIETPPVEAILCLGRSPAPIQSALVLNQLAPPEEWEDPIKQFKPTVALCCLGTTRKKAGSAAEFQRIDYGIPLGFAAACHRAGVRRFHLVSSIGASPRSKSLYLRTKGELERDLGDLGFEELAIYRPSLLIGPRKEHRLGEALAQNLSGKLSPIINILPLIKNYAPIAAQSLAAFIVRQIKVHPPGRGINIFENHVLLGA